MKEYYEPLENAFDYTNLVEGGKAELLACIKEWEESGKPFAGDDRIVVDEATLIPINVNGKLAFEAYCYEAVRGEMNKMFEGMKSTGLVESIEDNFITEGEGTGENDEFIFGDYVIYTNIEI